MRILGVVALCALSSLAGCHSDTAPTPAAKLPASAANPAVVKRGPTPEELSAGMVEAVAQGKSPLQALVKFELSERPVVGQELDIAVALLPKIAAAPATLKISAVSGLDLVPGYDHIEIPVVNGAEVYRNTVRVVPRQEGVALLSIELALKHEEATDSKLFTIPVVISAK